MEMTDGLLVRRFRVRLPADPQPITPKLQSKMRSRRRSRVDGDLEGPGTATHHIDGAEDLGFNRQPC
jgi:hypothetical protein